MSGAPSRTIFRPNAPNILIVLLDDVGFGLPDTFGGEVHTPTLTRLANEGIAYNAFHTTSICSPTRAALLTGRNHQRVGSGTIAERALDFDGYTGVIPKSAATIAEVLHDYGYNTAAFGKWHNTPATETTAMGPFDRWPTGYGFDYFYGFLAGETSQYEPRLFENPNPIEPPHDPTYHLSSDLADKALVWLRRHQSFAPDKPFLMYWAPGAAHGPHHIFKEWADKYKGKFDDGWDAYRERVFERQKEIGWIPPDTKLTPRADTMASWDSIPEAQRPFQRRLMEVFAGFVEHVDAQVGRLVDGLDEMGLRDNTIIFYVFGDNGSSAEGQNGTISELLAQNMIPNTIEQQLAALDKIGGLDALGHRQDRQHVSRRLGLGRRHAVPLHQAGRLAFRRHAQSAGDLVAEGRSSRTRRRGRSSTTSTTSRRRSTTSSASRRPRWSTGGSRCRSTASAWPTPSPTPRRPAASRPSISRTTAAARSITTAGSPRPSAR